MQKEHEFICIGCPKGCPVRLVADDKGEIIDVTNYECKVGKEYVQNEYKNPVRVLTGTVLTEGSQRLTLPFRTSKPIPKGKLTEAMRALAEVRAKPPVKMGQVIVSNILDSGADIVATDELRA